MVEPTSTMLHTKSQGNWPFGSRELDIQRVLPYMGVVAILVMLPDQFVSILANLS